MRERLHGHSPEQRVGSGNRRAVGGVGRRGTLPSAQLGLAALYPREALQFTASFFSYIGLSLKTWSVISICLFTEQMVLNICIEGTGSRTLRDSPKVTGSLNGGNWAWTFHAG